MMYSRTLHMLVVDTTQVCSRYCIGWLKALYRCAHAGASRVYISNVDVVRTSKQSVNKTAMFELSLQ